MSAGSIPSALGVFVQASGDPVGRVQDVMNRLFGMPVAIWVIVAAVVAACVPLPAPVIISDVDATQTAMAPPVTASAPGMATGSARTLRLGVLSWRGFDPFDAGDAGTEQVQALVYETLLAYEPAGNLIPLLAADLPVAGDDGLSWQVGLRAGVSFHDGTPLDALTAAETLQRPLEIAAQEEMLPFTVRVYRQLVESVSGEGMTLTFRLREPFRAFLALLAEQALALTHGIGIGSGPFRLAGSALEDNLLRLTRFEDYHGGAAALEMVEIHLGRQEPDSGAVIMESTGDSLFDLIAGESLASVNGLDYLEPWHVVEQEQWLILDAGHTALLPAGVNSVLALAGEGSADVYRVALAEIGLPDGFDLAVRVVAGQDSALAAVLPRFAPVHLQAVNAGQNVPADALIVVWRRDWERDWWLRVAGYADGDLAKAGVQLDVRPVVTYVRTGLTGLGVTSGGWARVTAQTDR